MGWFGRKRDPQDVNEVLRRYNEAEATRLADLASGVVGTPVTVSSAVATAELVVEDVFMITGRGQVVTGTVASGTVRVGESIVVLRDGADIGASKITGIEMFRKTATSAETGSLVGLVLRGTLDVARGDVIRTFTSA